MLYRLGHVQICICSQSGALELNRGVGYLEFFLEYLVNLGKNFCTVFHMHVGDADVTGKRVEVRAESPDMDIVNFLHPRYAQHGTRHTLEVDTAW